MAEDYEFGFMSSLVREKFSSVLIVVVVVVVLVQTHLRRRIMSLVSSNCADTL